MCHKMAALKVFCEVLIANIVKGAVSGLRQFLATESPWKIMKNTFYFILTNWICYWQVRFCTYYAFSLNRMSDIREVWKYWPLKDGFRSISQKFYRQPSKYCIAEFTAIFVCLLLSWSRRYSMKWSSNFDGP